jgi:hypothetical protein
VDDAVRVAVTHQSQRLERGEHVGGGGVRPRRGGNAGSPSRRRIQVHAVRSRELLQREAAGRLPVTEAMGEPWPVVVSDARWPILGLLIGAQRQGVLEVRLAARPLDIQAVQVPRAGRLVSDSPSMCLSKCRPTISRVGSPGRPIPSVQSGPNPVSKRPQSISPARRTSGCRRSIRFSSRARKRSSCGSASGCLGRIGGSGPWVRPSESRRAPGRNWSGQFASFPPPDPGEPANPDTSAGSKTPGLPPLSPYFTGD